MQDPFLLVLDEATAALDSASEMEVWETVAELRGRMAVLAISHQPALLEVADRVYLVENGRATLESGIEASEAGAARTPGGAH